MRSGEVCAKLRDTLDNVNLYRILYIYGFIKTCLESTLDIKVVTSFPKLLIRPKICKIDFVK